MLLGSASAALRPIEVDRPIPALSPFLPRSVGIHWLWFLVETISFFAAGAVGAKRKAAADAVASAAKAAPAPADDKADVAVAVPAA